jgi:hypothetical protein
MSNIGIQSIRTYQARALVSSFTNLSNLLQTRVPQVGERVMIPYGVRGPLALAEPPLPTCLGIYPTQEQTPFFVGREISADQQDTFYRKMPNGQVQPLEQQIYEWPDLFGAEATFINKIRAQKPGSSRQVPLLSIVEKAKMYIENVLMKNQTLDFIWYRLSVAEHITNQDILHWLALHDSDPNVRKVAVDNPYAPRSVYMDNCEFCSRQRWGPGSFPQGAYGSNEIGLKPNIFGFIPVRHYNLMAENWIHEISDIEFTLEVLKDLIELTHSKVQELKNGEDHRYISDTNGEDQEVTSDFDSSSIDGIIWGMNFGVERPFGTGLSGTRPHPSFASFQHFHAQFGVLPVGSYYEGDHMSEVCHIWEKIKTTWAPKGIDLFAKYIEALRNSPLNLLIWEDNNASPKTILVAPPSQRTVDEIQLICPSASNILRTDEETRESIAQGLYFAFKILDGMGHKTFNVISYGSRFSDLESGLRLHFRIMPRGGIAFSELQRRWVVNKFPETTAEEARKQMMEISPKAV